MADHECGGPTPGQPKEKTWTLWFCPECGEPAEVMLRPGTDGHAHGHYHDDPDNRFHKRIFHLAEPLTAAPQERLEEVEAERDARNELIGLRDTQIEEARRQIEAIERERDAQKAAGMDEFARAKGAEVERDYAKKDLSAAEAKLAAFAGPPCPNCDGGFISGVEPRAKKAETDLEEREATLDEAFDFAAESPEKIARLLSEPVRDAIIAQANQEDGGRHGG